MKYKKLLFLLPLFLFCNCHTSKKILTYPKQLTALESSEANTITIRSSGTGKSAVGAVENAEVNAFEALLFRGFPSSVQERPIIENESESKTRNKFFFISFFDERNYQSFIISSSNYTGVQKSQGYFYLIREIKINLMSLRTELENKDIIRKFGY